MIEAQQVKDDGRHVAAPGPDHETAWRAVRARDAAFDGRFVFAVTSTGIYCRPSCPARRPHRHHVRFFDAAAMAEAAGFRPCRRCHPEQAKGVEAERRIERARRYLEDHLDETVTLERLGRKVGLSPGHLQRTFKRLVGVSPKEYVRARRLEALKTSLRDSDNVLDAAFAAGYGASSRAYDPDNAPLGMSPGAYRRGGQGMRIHYTIVPSPAGRLLVGATERGVSAVMIGDADEELEAALSREYPRAQLERATDGLDQAVQTVLRHLEEGEPMLDLPLDVSATLFQWRVWKCLRQIPYGETRSYSHVARAIGKPGAVRAVARACATNPVALVVPCHRVVRQDGRTGGYRWGSERKHRLLVQERPDGEGE